MLQPFRRLLTVLLLALACAGGPVAAQTFPALTGRVIDEANIIPPEAEAQLDAKLTALEKQSQRQVVVVTLQSLQGYDIADYGYQLGRKWGIGSAARNDGAMLIIAPNERKVRIEVGYGLEPVLTDGMSFLIINNAILPHFKAGDMPGGIVAGTDQIIKQLTLPEDQARALAAKANTAQKETSGEGVPIGMIIWIIIIVFFFILPMIRGVRGGRAYRRGGPPVILFPGGGFGGGGGGFGGGGFGGGGFSGGGGGFGGGGASGSW